MALLLVHLRHRVVRILHSGPAVILCNSYGLELCATLLLERLDKGELRVSLGLLYELTQYTSMPSDTAVFFGCQPVSAAPREGRANRGVIHATS